MHLVQILLPVYRPTGETFPQEMYGRVRDELTACFGGLTAYHRSSATRLWKQDETSTVRDDIVIYEVMVEQLDRGWWHEYREDVRQHFDQESLVVRASAVEML